METGHEFLRSQVNNCVMQHHALLDALRTHAEQADDAAFRELCVRFIPSLERHQTMIEAYGDSIGTRGGGAVKNAIGAVLAKARDAVDAFRESDFLRAVGDVVMIRQAQDTFAVFAIAGEQLSDVALAELGRTGEREHDEMQREFNRYLATLFVAHVHGTAPTRTASESPSFVA